MAADRQAGKGQARAAHKKVLHFDPVKGKNPTFHEADGAGSRK